MFFAIILLNVANENESNRFFLLRAAKGLCPAQCGALWEKIASMLEYLAVLEPRLRLSSAIS